LHPEAGPANLACRVPGPIALRKFRYWPRPKVPRSAVVARVACSPTSTLGAVATASSFLRASAPLAFAHRGGAGEAPENTWAAFEHAISLGFRYMETDVRASADGTAVAMHDPRLDRVAATRGQVRRMTWDQLKCLPLRAGSSIPSLEDLLGAWPEICWNIDVKESAAIEPVIEALRRTRSAQRVLVAAFSGSRSRMLRKAFGPEIAIGAGRWAVAALVGAKFAPILGSLARVDAAQVPPRRGGARIVDSRFVSSCHRKGLPVHVWTINDAVDMEQLLDLGVDGIMTDRPSVLKAVLEKRGQW